MRITPDRLYFWGTLDDPRPLTATVSIERIGTSPFTWTASFDPSALPSLALAPTGGAAPGSMVVSADLGAFSGTGTLALTGTFAFTLSITADPTTTVGSLFTLPVTLRVTQHRGQSFLPFVQNGIAPPPTPTPTPSPSATPSSTPSPTPGPVTPTTSYGLSFVTLVESPADEARFQRAMETGAKWDRWPLYWPNVERREGEFEWGAVDRAVISDTAHGLQVDAVLLFTPNFYASGGNSSVPMPRLGPQSRREYGGPHMQDTSSISSAASPPVRLGEPVFADGTDLPGITKTINPNNPWARFVYETVNRYKPGGALALEQGWPAERGVRHWEIWNEEDAAGFWLGTVDEYARLLKVAYLAARHADSHAKIILGGLANYGKPTWLKDTLATINTYPDKDAGNWFFDSVAEHNYAWAWQTWYYLYQATKTFETYSITHKSLWVSESGVGICNDYPGPTCIHGDPPTYRASLEEQAAFVIQSAAYATWINSVTPVDVFIHFQLYDDCTNYYPEYDIAGGFGLIRNPTGWGCGSSPAPNMPRPSYAAFQMVTRYLTDIIPMWRARPGWVFGDPTRHGQEWLTFYHPSTQERVMAMWARGYVTETAVISATSTSAQLVGLDGTWHTITPTGGVYTVTLPAATNRSMPTDGVGSAPIGGCPYLLLESDPTGTGGQ